MRRANRLPLEHPAKMLTSMPVTGSDTTPAALRILGPAWAWRQDVPREAPLERALGHLRQAEAV
eukprot:2828401-Lingulodinium_polyedra.AAC.1